MDTNVDTIIVKIKCKQKYRLLNTLRDQGGLFDAIRQALESDDDGVQELTWEEYKILEGVQKNEDKYDKS